MRVYGAAPEPTVEERKSTFVFQPSTFGTILNANGENPKVIQELLRRFQFNTYSLFPTT